MTDAMCPILAQCVCSDVDERCRERQCAWWVWGDMDGEECMSGCALALLGARAMAEVVKATKAGFNG